jgi:hypothetical protein
MKGGEHFGEWTWLVAREEGSVGAVGVPLFAGQQVLIGLAAQGVQRDLFPPGNVAERCLGRPVAYRALYLQLLGRECGQNLLLSCAHWYAPHGSIPTSTDWANEYPTTQ